MFVEPSVALIFGGCCSNVFALEAIVKHEPGSGLLITVTQLLATALISLPSQIERIPPKTLAAQAASRDGTFLADIAGYLRQTFPYRLRPPLIPFVHLAVMAFVFCAVNMLNNWAFAFDISVPLHIILRSFGSVTTLTVGWLAGKTYSRWQVASVLGLTIGVVTSAWADAAAKGASMSIKASDSGQQTTSFLSGLAILFLAQVLGAVQGIYTEKTYEKFGRHWLETMFYSHFLGIIFSLVFIPGLRNQLARLLAGPRFSIPSTLLTMVTPYLPSLPVPLRRTLESLDLPKFPIFALLQHISPWSGAAPSTSFLLLLLNAATQVLCISGVNRLAARTTAVTVTVVLNIRKLASFLLSCWIFGNKLSNMMVLGATIVFISGGVYGWDSSKQRKPKSRDEKPAITETKPLETEADISDTEINKDKRGRKTAQSAKRIGSRSRGAETSSTRSRPRARESLDAAPESKKRTVSRDTGTTRRRPRKSIANGAAPESRTRSVSTRRRSRKL